MSAPTEIRVAIIGPGRHGRDLINYALDIPGVRFQAVCDIWPYNRKYAAGLLKKRGHPATAYEDYRDLLATEKGLDAAIIATPDSFHADQTVACLEAGLHVYCEKEMHHTLAGARRMVLAAQRTKKLLQIGRQHRSNPRYFTALDFLNAKKAVGRITHVYGQWHGHKRVPYTWPKALEIPVETLVKYGYESMDEHRNWRWREKFSAGEIANLASHQIDVFNWFLGALPKAVMASGGLDYCTQYELYDNATCLFDWDYAWQGVTRTVRGMHVTLTTTDDGGFYEAFMGDEGVLGISEDTAKGGIFREAQALTGAWEKDLSGLVISCSGCDPRSIPPNSYCWLRHWLSYGLPPQSNRECCLSHRYTAPSLPRYPPIPSPPNDRPPHWHHLKNFFDAVRGDARLNCPAEVGYQTAVVVFRAIEAMRAGRKLTLAPEDFVVAEKVPSQG